MAIFDIVFTNPELSSGFVSPRAEYKAPLVGRAITFPIDENAPRVVTELTGVPATRSINITGGPTYLYTPTPMSAVDCAYDQQNRLWVCYICDAVGYLYWYDSLAQQMVTTNFGPVAQAFLLTDDVRFEAVSTNTNTVVFVYLRDSTVYYRDQQDRFTIEYTAVGLPAGHYIEQVGMTTATRLEIRVAEDTYVYDRNWDVGSMGPAPWYPLDTTTASSYVLQVVLESRVVAKTLKEAMASSGVVDIGLPVQYADNITSTPLGLITETTQTRDNLAGSGVTTISAG